MSKIPKALYEEISQLTPQIAKDYFTPAKKPNTYICDICGNGTGNKGDGLVIYPNGIIKCFKAGCPFNGGDLVAYTAHQHHLDPNSYEAVKVTCETYPNELSQVFNKYFANTDTTPTYTGNNAKMPKIHTHNNTPSPKHSQAQKDKEKAILDVLEGTDTRFKRQIETARASMEHPTAQRYLKERGIAPETAEEFKIGYISNPIFLEKRTDRDGKPYEFNINDCLVFPVGLGRLTTRKLSHATHDSYKSDKPQGLDDIPFGVDRVIRDKDKKPREPIFLVEGQIDAMSLFQAGADGVSLNGNGNINTLAMILNHYGIKRPLILALDNDLGDRGEQRKADIVKELEEAGLEAYSVDLIPQGLTLDNGETVTDANDYMRLDLNAFAEAVDTAKAIPNKEFEESFNKAKLADFLGEQDKRVSAPAVPTGFSVLDSEYFLDGGLYEGLYIIGAISALGKTAFTLQLADQIAEQGNDVLYLSLEMSANELRFRSISRYTVKDLTGTPYDLETLPKTVRQLTNRHRYSPTPQEEAHIANATFNYFSDTGNTMRIIEGIGTISADTVRSLVDEHVRHRGKAPIVFIDYLQLMAQPADENGRKHSMTDKQIVDANVMLLKQISRDYKTPVFAISSFNRDNYNNEVSMLSFKESGAIEYSSDVLIGLERQNQPRRGKSESDKQRYEIEIKKLEQSEIDTGIRKVRLKIIKNRNGQAGGKIIYNYSFRYNYFDEIGNEYEILEAERKRKELEDRLVTRR